MDTRSTPEAETRRAAQGDAPLLRALVVEDSEADAELLGRELRKCAGRIHLERVTTATGLHQALERQSWDVVISDYTLPGLSGEEVLRQVRARDAEVPFIFVSGTVGEERAVGLLKAGADDYVMKDRLARLAPCVQHQLRIAAERRERKRSDEALRESEERFRQMAENIDAFFYLTDPQNSRIFYASPAYEKVWGRSLESLYADPASWRSAVHPEDRGVVAERMEQAVTGAIERRYRIVRPDGAVRWVRSRGFPVRGADGKAYRIAGIIEDVTERKLAEDRVARLNRVYAVLSGINSLIVRASGREELFRESCRVAVDHGKFPLAWIGLIVPAEKHIRAVAWAGAAQGYIERMPMALEAARPRGPGMGALAIREKKAMIANDLASDPRVQTKDAALERGLRSLVILPLIVGREAVGVLALYAEQTGFFDDEEMKLLDELAGDISFALEHIEKSEKLNYLAYYDALTGLANRSLLLEHLDQYLHGSEAGARSSAVIVCDLERFRAVNDSLGRQAGDALLKQFAERLLANVGDKNQLSRLGADVFAIVLPEVKNEFEAASRLRQLSERCLGEPFQVGGAELRMSAKAGVALFPGHGADAEALLSNADKALKKCKTAGERHLFFDEAMSQRVADKLGLENQLRRALERDEFVLHYQPRIDLETRRVTGVEALIRWQSEAGLVPPAQFIPLLEETGLILEVGDWALAQAVRQHRRWKDSGIAAQRVAVNVSAVQLRQRDFVSRVKRALERGAVPPGVDLEITESMVMEDTAENIAKLGAVRDLGVNVAIDDFGTGYSSLAYLAKLPVSSLKIDRSFIVTMLDDPNTTSLVSTIISLAHSLRLKVVAEGVESENQAKVLRLLRCDEMQGYLYSRPLPAEALVELLEGSTAPT